MFRSFRSSLIVIAPTLIVLAACSKDSSTTPAVVTDATIATKDVAAEVGASTASILASQTLADVNSGAAPRSVLLVPSGVFADIASTPLFASTTCTGPTVATSTNPPGAGWYVCAKTTDGGITAQRAHRYFAAGSVVPNFGATVDSVQHLWSETGTQVDTAKGTDAAVRSRWVSRGDTASQKITRAVAASGATPAVPESRTWNSRGFNADSANVVDAHGTRRWSFSGARATTNLVYQLPKSANPYPMSGTISHNWTSRLINLHISGKADTTTTTRTSSATFNGTQQATITVGGLSCTLDLKTHLVSGCK